jgi:hypothetical protein
LNAFFLLTFIFFIITSEQINSYNSHQFIVKFQNPKSGVNSEVKFTKGPKEEVITISYSRTEGLTVKQVTKFDELLMQVKDQTASCSTMKGKEFGSCFAKGITDQISKVDDSATQVKKYRDLISARLRNYTCEDETMETSKPIRSKIFTIENKKYDIDVLLDMPNAKIWAVHDLITDEECDILERHGRPNLARATVAADDGSSVYSENRKAQQTGYSLYQTDPNDPLHSLNKRVLAVTNLHTGYNLQPVGQEDFTIIQYNKDDQYTPHCDGSCDGSEYKAGGRVATAVMYCQVAERGGGTTFTKADIFVKPYRGMATFFAYKDFNGTVVDDGFTEHSGCPVLQGEKWITTLWMRDGVDAENNWTDFDPSGVKVAVEEESVIVDSEGGASI